MGKMNIKFTDDILTGVLYMDTVSPPVLSEGFVGAKYYFSSGSTYIADFTWSVIHSLFS